MAGKGGVDEVEIDLELDVLFNEFDDEFKETAQHTTQHSNRQDNSNDKKAQIRDNSNKLEHTDVRLTLKKETSNGQNTTINKPKSVKSNPTHLGQLDSEEGEVKSDEELDSKTVGKFERACNEVFQENTVEDTKFPTEEVSLTSNTMVQDEVAMDVDEDKLLESEDESFGDKKCEVEKSKSENRNEDQVMKVQRRTRGGRKKRDKRLKDIRQRIQNARKIHPVIGRLFQPLTADEDDTPECLARQLADRLEEDKDDLILRVVKILGPKKAIKIFQETKKVQMDGGMMTSDKYRKRTSGGIFLNIMKCDGYATKEQVKEIYAEEREKEKQLLKERKLKEQEIREGEINDLRELLAKKKEVLSKIEMENKVDT